MNINNLKKYIFSEKSQKLMTENGVHTFIVDRKLNKFQIKKELESHFSDDSNGKLVIGKVRTCSTKKILKKKNGRTHTKIIKKAFVKINFFPKKAEENNSLIQ